MTTSHLRLQAWMPGRIVSGSSVIAGEMLPSMTSHTRRNSPTVSDTEAPWVTSSMAPAERASHMLCACERWCSLHVLITSSVHGIGRSACLHIAASHNRGALPSSKTARRSEQVGVHTR